MSGSFSSNTAGIQAALPAQQQTNPLQMLSTLQGIKNQQVQNQLYQQDLLNRQQELQNLQLTNQTGTIANTKTLQGMAAGVSWMLHTDPNLNYQRAMQGIDGAESMGYPSSQLEKVRSMITPDMSPDQMRELFGRIALNSVAANDPEKAQRMMNPATGTITSGQVTYPTLIPQTGDMQGRTPGVPILAWNENQGIGAPAGVRQLPAPAFQTNYPPGSTQPEERPAPALDPNGNPVGTQPSAAPSAAVPTAAPAAPVVPLGAPGTPPPVQINGGAVNPANPTAPPIGAPGTPPLLQPQTMAQAGAQQPWNRSGLAGTVGNALPAEAAASVQFPQRDQQDSAILTALRNTKTGPGTAPLQHWQALAQTLFPQAAAAMGQNPTPSEYYAEAVKYFNARNMGISGTGATDYAREQTNLSNPNPDVFEPAAYHMQQINQAFSRMRQAGLQTYMETHPNVNLADPAANNDFTKYQTQFAANNDYRGFMPKVGLNGNDSEYRTMIKSIPTTGNARANFQHSAIIAQHYWPND